MLQSLNEKLIGILDASHEIVLLLLMECTVCKCQDLVFFHISTKSQFNEGKTWLQTASLCFLTSFFFFLFSLLYKNLKN